MTAGKSTSPASSLPWLEPLPPHPHPGALGALIPLSSHVPLSPPQGSVGTGVQILAVSHTGIKLLQMIRGSREADRQLRVLRTYR